MSNRPVTDIKSQLRLDEGTNLKLYRDTADVIGFEGRKGNVTIGTGINLEIGISPAEDNWLLDNRIAVATAFLRVKLPWVDELDEARLGVLLNMTFNLGIDGVLKFKGMLGWLQRKDYSRAAAEMVDSLWYHQVGERAKRLVEQMLTGQWQ